MKQREIDTFINMEASVKEEYQDTKTVMEDLNFAILQLPGLARKLSSFRRLERIEAVRDISMDYQNGEYGTLITSRLIGDSQPSEENIDRFNTMIPAFIQSTLLASGHYDKVTVTL